MTKLFFNFKQWRIESLLVALFLVFMCCVFAPLEFYNGNSLDFWFTIDYIVGYILVLAVAIIFLTLILFSVMVKGKPYLGAVFWGLMIAMYIQGNFMFKKYGTLDGHQMFLDDSSGYAIFNTIIWLIIPILSCLILRFYEAVFRSVLKYISLGILAVQLITIVVLWIINPVQMVGKEAYSFSTDGMFDYSDDENIVIFVADTFAGELFEQLIEEEPNIKDCFDGFTWYSDYSGAYQLTNESVPFLFNPEWYYNEGEYEEIRYKSLNKDGFFEKIKNKAGYDIVFCSEIRGFNEVENKSIFENLNKVDCDSQLLLGADYYKMLCFRYMPYVLKKYFTVFQGTFDRHKIIRGGSELYSDANERFMKELDDIPFTHTSVNKRFEVLHISGAHFPYTVTSELKVVGANQTDILNQSVASVKLFEQYIDNMKKNNTYDNTTIFFISDHGLHDIPESQPVFLIKPKNSRGPMKMNCVPISATQILPTLSDLTGIEYNGNEQSLFSKTNTYGFVRKFMYCNGESKKALKNLTEYDVYPGLFMVRRNKYSLGKVENFESSDKKICSDAVLNSKDIFEYSQVGVDEEGMLSPSACFVFPTEIYDSGIQISISAVAEPNYKYQFYIYNQLIGEYDYEQFVNNTIEVSVPAELVNNGVVNLKIKTLGHIITGKELATSENPGGRGKFLKIDQMMFSGMKK